MSNVKKYVLLSILILFAFCAVGCGTFTEDDLFKETGTEVTTEQKIEQSSSGGGFIFTLENLPELWYNGSVYAKRWAPVLIVGSLLLGWIIYDVFKKVPEVKKWALNFMIIKIPIFTLVIVYVYSFLYGMLNF